MRTRPTHEKRRKEQARQERQKDKAERRAQRKVAKAEGTSEQSDGDGLVTGEPSLAPETPAAPNAMEPMEQSNL